MPSRYVTLRSNGGVWLVTILRSELTKRRKGKRGRYDLRWWSIVRN
jgi:hypothetical protein